MSEKYMNIGNKSLQLMCTTIAIQATFWFSFATSIWNTCNIPMKHLKHEFCNIWEAVAGRFQPLGSKTAAREDHHHKRRHHRPWLGRAGGARNGRGAERAPSPPMSPALALARPGGRHARRAERAPPPPALARLSERLEGASSMCNGGGRVGVRRPDGTDASVISSRVFIPLFSISMST
jgi:hypothetical protein